MIKDYEKMYWAKVHELKREKDFYEDILRQMSEKENELLFNTPSMRWWVFWKTIEYKLEKLKTRLLG